jgi:hypothetical protein
MSFSRAVTFFLLGILFLKDGTATGTPIVCENYQLTLRDITEDRDVARKR